MFFQSHVVENIFQNRARLNFSIHLTMKIKLFVFLETQYFELRFSLLTHMFTM